MPATPKTIYRSLVICLWLLAAQYPMMAQPGKDAISLTHAWPYKDGVIVLTNTYAPDKKKDNSILTDAYRPQGTYVYSVYGKRTTLFAMAYTYGHKIPDTIRFAPFYEGNRQTYLTPANLLTRIRKNGTTIQDWTPVHLSTPSVDSFIGYYQKKNHREIFVLADDTLHIDDVMVVDGRLRTDTTILFTYYIRGVPRPIRPRLLAWSHEWGGKESRISPAMINRHIVGRNIVVDKFENGDLKGGDGAVFHNEHIVPTSSFIFYFGKADAAFADSTLEYRILGGRYTDSNWIRTGHVIMMDGLTGDERYSLEVRYAGYPENTVLHTFVTNPYWYQRNWLRWSTAGVLFLLALLLIITSYRRRLVKEKSKKAALADKLRNMQTQLNPHFIFNALGSIQALMSKQENDKAHQYLSAFGSLLRHVLTNSNQDTTTLDKEIKSLEVYLQLEQLRFSFQYSINVAEDLSTSTISLPVMLLQPLVENAIKHGIAGMEAKGNIRLSFSKEGFNLLALVEDNGKGFDTRQPSTGYGLKLVREKIQLLNSLQEERAIVMDLHPGNAGTTVLLTFKNWLA